VKKQIRVAVFISGKGTNALNLMHYFEKHESIVISLIFSSQTNDTIENATCLYNVGYSEWQESQGCWSDIANQLCLNYKIDFIVLAGFLKKIPASMIDRFPHRIINLHPSLLPKFGGKGMYGNHVHQAVISAGEQKSGITIHYVNEEFDEGEIISQHEVVISKKETAISLAVKVHALELKFFPKVLENLLCSNFKFQTIIETS
jgi:phosphoribosylglycinamide formyltransferase-1